MNCIITEQIKAKRIENHTTILILTAVYPFKLIMKTQLVLWWCCSTLFRLRLLLAIQEINRLYLILFRHWLFL
jgi:hypothetical protein